MRAWFLVMLIHSSAQAAPASAKVNFKQMPPATEIVGMSPGNYYRVLIVDEYGKVESVVAKVRKAAADGDPADAAATYDDLNTTLGEARKRLVGFPAYKDEDGTLRDAVITAYVAWGKLAVRERDEAAPLAAKIPRSDADVRAWEKVRLDLDAGWTASNAKVKEAVSAFAEPNRLVMVAEEPAAPAASFEAEGLPIGNSKLPIPLWLSSAVRYHNALFEAAGTMAKAMAGATEKMNTTDLEPARVEALAKIKPVLAEAQKFGPFGGDSGFRDAVVGYGEWMVAELEGPLKEYAALTREGAVTRDVADRLNAMGETLNTEAGARAATLQEQRQRFMTTWHFEAWVAWQKGR